MEIIKFCNSFQIKLHVFQYNCSKCKKLVSATERFKEHFEQHWKCSAKGVNRMYRNPRFELVLHCQQILQKKISRLSVKSNHCWQSYFLCTKLIFQFQQLPWVTMGVFLVRNFCYIIFYLDMPSEFTVKENRSSFLASIFFKILAQRTNFAQNWASPLAGL